MFDKELNKYMRRKQGQAGCEQTSFVFQDKLKVRFALKFAILLLLNTLCVCRLKREASMFVMSGFKPTVYEIANLLLHH